MRPSLKKPIELSVDASDCSERVFNRTYDFRKLSFHFFTEARPIGIEVDSRVWDRDLKGRLGGRGSLTKRVEHGELA